MAFFRIGSVLLLITCGLHLFGHFSNAPTNDAERQLFETMAATQLDTGGGKTISMMSLYLGLSLCFSLLFAWSGALGLAMSYRLANHTGVLKTMAWMYTGALAVGSCIGLYYFFFAPNFCLIVCGVFFLVAALRLKRG